MATATVARDIMSSNPHIMKVDDTAGDIAKVLADEGIGAVVICNDENRLQGMVTDRDLTVEVIARGKDPKTTKASELLDGTEVVTIGADDTVEEAVATMKSHAVRRLPVIDGTEVVGMVSQADIAKAADRDLVGKLVEAISEAPDNTGRG
jgi:CBS domain-containing protein